MAAADDDWAPVAPPAQAAAADDDWQSVNPAPRSAIGQASDAVLGYLKTTSTGRTLEAFGQGWSDGWGDEPLGLSKDSEKALRDAGVFQDLQTGHGGTLRAMNEALMRPAAAALDFAFNRVPSAAATGIAKAAGENVAIHQEQAGASPQQAAQHGDELTRDTLALANVLGVIGGGEAGFKGTKPIETARTVAADTRYEAHVDRAAEPPAPAAEAAPAAAPEAPAPASEAAQPEVLAPSAPATKRVTDMSQEDLQAAADEAQLSDRDKLVKAFGEDGAKDFTRLQRTQNSADPQRAAAAGREFDAKFGDLTPEQERLAYGVGEPGWQAEDYRAFAKAADSLSDMPTEEVVRSLTRGMLDSSPEDALAAINSGEGSAKDVANAIKIKSALAELARRGTTPAELNDLTGRWMAERGYSPANAAEVLSNWTEMFKRGPQPEPAPQIAPPAHQPLPPEPKNPQSIAAPSTPHEIYGDAGASDVVDKAGNINLDRIAAPDDVKDVIRQVADANGGFMDERRGTMSYSETLDLADAIGMTPEQLLKRNVGDAFNAEQAVAARNLLVQSANDLRDLALKAAGGTEADQMAYLQAETRHAAIQEQVAGMTAEAGRALSSFNIKAGEMDRAAAVSKIIADNGGREGIDARARLIGQLDTPQQVSKFLMDGRKSTLMDKVVEVWRNALLTGPQTHATYLVSNMLHGLLGVADTTTAAGIGLFRSGERVVPGEIGAHAVGLAKGGLEGIKTAARQLRTGVAADRAFSDAARGAIPGVAGEIVRTPSKVVSAIGEIYQGMGYRAELNRRAVRQASREMETARKPVGALEETPTMLRYDVPGPDGKPGGVFIEAQKRPDGNFRIAGADSLEAMRGKGYGIEAYRAVADRALALGAELHSDWQVSESAARVYAALERRGYTVEKAAGSEFVDGAWYTADHAPVFRVTDGPREPVAAHRPDLASRVAQLIASPTQAMLDAAHEAALDQAFLTPPGPMTKAIQTITNKAPALKFVLPFTTVPGNIMRSAFMDRTPLGLFSQEVRGDLLGKNGPVAQDTAAAKMFVGSAIGAGVMALAAQGLVSGNGPTDPRERAMLMTTGWRPNSVNIGGVWYAYNRFAPMAMVMSLSADSVYIAQHASHEEASQVAANVVASLVKTPLNQSWLSSTASLIEAIEDPDRYGQKFVQNLIGSMAVPTGLAQYTHSQDPYLRDARTVVDAINARTPWSWDKVPVRRDIWGEPMLRGDTFGPALLSTVYESRANADPVNKAFNELNIFPAPLERKIRGVDLTPEQYDRFQTVAGRSAKLMESQIVGSPGFAELPDFARRELLVNTLNAARESARSVVMMENPGIVQQALATKMGQIDGTLTLGKKPVPK